MSDLLGPFELDQGARRCGPDGRLLIGGSPLRLLRLSAAGSELLDRLGDGAVVRATTGVRDLIERLVDGGVLHPRPVPRGGVVAPEVTVVVPVRDHAPALERLLGSLARARPRAGHMVIVDDGSTDPDRVADVVARCAPGAATLVRSARSEGPAAARNVGASHVETDVLAFVDADCTVGEDWLGPLLAQLDGPMVDAVAPRVVAATSSSAGLLERYDAVRSPLDLGPRPARVEPGTRIAYVPSAAFVVRADVFERSGGFDESMRVGEDVDLVWRLTEQGFRVRYEPRAVVAHEVRGDLWAWVRQRTDYGCSAAPLDRRHPGRVAPVSCSPWSALLWLLVAVGRYESAAIVAVGTTVRLRSTLGGLDTKDVVRLVGTGHLGAGEQLARAMVRVWWPIALVASTGSRRVRRVLVVSAGVTAVLAAARAGAATVGPSGAADRRRSAPLVAVLALLDDLAYGAGVWRGCWRERSWRAVLPRLSGSAGRSADCRAPGPAPRRPTSAGPPT